MELGACSEPDHSSDILAPKGHVTRGVQTNRHLNQRTKKEKEYNVAMPTCQLNQTCMAPFSQDINPSIPSPHPLRMWSAPKWVLIAAVIQHRIFQKRGQMLISRVYWRLQGSWPFLDVTAWRQGAQRPNHKNASSYPRASVLAGDQGTTVISSLPLRLRVSHLSLGAGLMRVWQTTQCPWLRNCQVWSEIRRNDQPADKSKYTCWQLNHELRQKGALEERSLGLTSDAAGLLENGPRGGGWNFKGQ